MRLTLPLCALLAISGCASNSSSTTGSSASKSAPKKYNSIEASTPVTDPSTDPRYAHLPYLPMPRAPEFVAETTEQHDARMQWWREARFGMFIHWGLYAVPAGRWPGYEKDNIGEWIQRNAKIPVNEYEKLADQFNPTKFNADAWVKVAKDAGCRYIVITSKHHDGFSMFDSSVSNYDIVESTPYKHDPMKDLARACQRQGVKFAFYHSIWDWHNADFRKERMALFIKYMKGQLKELLTNYGEIGLLWFDGEWPDEWTEEMGADLYKYVRGIQPSLIVNNRVGKARDDMAGISRYKGAGDYDTPEQEVPSRGLPGVDWETCMTMNDTWGFRLDDHNWKSSTQLIHTLVEVVSKGGNFLLNVGPTAEGQIPPESIKLLADIGAWMNVNSRAIYATSASPFNSLPWGRATQKKVGDKTTIYLHVFDWPTDGTLRVPGLKSLPTSVAVLGGQHDVRATLAPDSGPNGGDVLIGLARTPVNPAATVIELNYDSPPTIEQVVVPAQRQQQGGTISLLASTADIPGHYPKIEKRADMDCLGFWTDAKGAAQWTVDVTQPGAFDVSLELSCADESNGEPYVLLVTAPNTPSVEARGVVPSTGGWDKFTTVTPGRITLPQPGKYTFTLKPANDKLKFALMNLRQISLTPAK